MKKLFILLCLIVLPILGNSQNGTSIIMNDVLIEDFFEDFIQDATDRGLDIQDKLLSEINYILIVPEEQYNVNDLAEFDSSNKMIKLSSKVKIDRLILKINLYRELSHILGVPYDQGSVIMNRKQKEGFSYAAFDDIDIMYVEMNRILSVLLK